MVMRLGDDLFQGDNYRYTTPLRISSYRENIFIEFHDKYYRFLKDLIKNSKENLAFSQFIQSFPSCLPKRTYIRNLFDSFKNC